MTTVLRETPQVASQVELRWLTADDWQDLCCMRLAALTVSPDAFLARYEEEVLFGEEEWRAVLRPGNWALAYREAEAIGMVGVTCHHDIPADGRYLEFLWLDPFWRRKGIASEFVEKVIDDLAAVRVNSIWLWILDGNDVAWNFYKRLGFTADRGPIKLPKYPDRSETRMTRNLLTAT
jgi:ribosomal protein S18 acetylase RimI-like enzyme